MRFVPGCGSMIEMAAPRLSRTVFVSASAYLGEVGCLMSRVEVHIEIGADACVS